MKKNNPKKRFCLFACCILVHGARRTALCDMQRGHIVYLTKDQVNILDALQKFPCEEALKLYDEASQPVFEKFVNELEAGALGFYTYQPTQFPAIDMAWEWPFVFSNMVVDLTSAPSDDLIKFVHSVCQEGCSALQIRSFDKTSIADLDRLLQVTKDSSIRSIELILPYDEVLISAKHLHSLIDEHLRITTIILFSSPEEKIEQYRSFNIHFINESISNEKHCGVITRSGFSLNINSFSEFTRFNSCLNRKIAVDGAGNIKNCPSLPQSFGNIRNTSLQEVMADPDLKKYWNITKDQVNVCKDCEFRYICTDCRAYLEKPEDIYSKPLKCGYDPYTCEWEEWSTHPLKQKAIDYYGMREVLPKFNMKPDYAPPTSAESITA